MDDVEQTLSAFIETEFAYDREPAHVGVDESLLDGGLIDSVGVLRLAAFIEEKFGLEIQDEDLVPEHFATVRSVAEFIRSRTSGVVG